MKVILAVQKEKKGLNLTYIIYKYFFIYCYSSVESEVTKHACTLVVPNFLNTLIFFSVVKYSLSVLVMILVSFLLNLSEPLG